MSSERETDITHNLDMLSDSLEDSQDMSVPYLVVLAGESVGRVIRLHKSQEMTIGRARECDIYLDCDNISRRHSSLEVDQDGVTTLVDLNSTNGSLVNGKKVRTQVLADGDRVCFGNVILRFSHKDGLEFDFQKNLYDKATRDPLTGAFNKRYFMENLQKDFSFHQRQNSPLSILMMDLDDFKRVNDTYGHVNGDIVLKTLAKEAEACIRQEDILARFGGEEFVALFRSTDRETLLGIAQKLWQLVQDLSFDTSDGSFGVGITIGAATLVDGSYESPDEFLMAADRNLYVGKKEGKNRIVG